MLGIEESRDRLADGREAFVQEREDFVEGADAGGSRTSASARTSTSGAASLARPASSVLTVADDERELARHDRPGVLLRAWRGRGGVSVSVIFWMSSCTATSERPPDTRCRRADRRRGLDLHGAVLAAKRPGLKELDEAWQQLRAASASASAPSVTASTDLRPRALAGRLARVTARHRSPGSRSRRCRVSASTSSAKSVLAGIDENR